MFSSNKTYTCIALTSLFFLITTKLPTSSIETRFMSTKTKTSIKADDVKKRAKSIRESAAYY